MGQWELLGFCQGMVERLVTHFLDGTATKGPTTLVYTQGIDQRTMWYLILNEEKQSQCITPCDYHGSV